MEIKLTMRQSLTVLFVFVGAVTFAFVLSIVYPYKGLQRGWSELLHANAIENEMLKCRQNEKDFLARKNLKYLDNFNKIHGKLMEEIKALKALIPEDQRLLKIESYATKYKDLFLDIAALTEKIGLTHDQGLKGRLRKAVHEAEQVFKSANDESLMSKILMCRRREKDFLLRNDPKYIEKFKQDLSGLIEAVNNSALPTETKNIARIKLKAYRDDFLALIQAKMEVGLDHKSGLMGKMRNTVHKIEPVIIELNHAVEASQQRIKREMITRASIILAIECFAILFVVYWWGHDTQKGITALLKEINDLTTGKTSLIQGINVNNVVSNMASEFEAIAESVNSFAKTIGQTVLDSKNKTQVVTTEAKGLLDMADHMDTRAHKMAEQAGKVKEKARMGSENVSNVSAAVDEMTATINEISRNMNDVNQLAVKAENQAVISQEVINALSDSANRIVNLSTIIGSIAEQTNLLALNATIEAARAGEAGKGFAVVANEVKELAKQTGDSVGEIESVITDLKDRAQKAIESVENIVHANTEVSGLSNDVATAIEEQTAAISEVSRNALLANEAVVKIEEMITDIFNSTEDISEKAENVKSSAFKFDKVASELSENMKKFNV